MPRYDFSLPVLQETIFQDVDTDRVRRGRSDLPSLRQRGRGAELGGILCHDFKKECLSRLPNQKLP